MPYKCFTYLVDVLEIRDSSTLDEIPSDDIVLPILVLLVKLRDQN